MKEQRVPWALQVLVSSSLLGPLHKGKQVKLGERGFFQVLPFRIKFKSFPEKSDNGHIPDPKSPCHVGRHLNLFLQLGRACATKTMNYVWTGLGERDEDGV